ncbi:MAG: DHH family phosphoesterase [Bacteroidia bacterium]
MMHTTGFEDLKQLLQKPLNIVITTHHKPDGDAMGSSLALYNALKQLRHQVQVITPNDYGQFLHWLPGNEQVIEFENSEQSARERLTQAELLFCLDFNDLKRINEMGDFIRTLNLPSVMIDHHLHPSGFETYTFHNPEASSTCELIYDFLHMLGQEQLINADVAACIYTGIMTDTGSFKFPATSPRVHRIVAELMERGANHTQIHEAVFDQMSENVLRFLGHCFIHKLRVLPEIHTAYITVTAEEIRQFGLQTGDTEGLVNYALNIRGIRFAALIIDRTKLVKMSFRSKGKVPANEFASQWFEGGGHFNAAGGQSSDNLDITEARFLEALKSFSEKILKA